MIEDYSGFVQISDVILRYLKLKKKNKVLPFLISDFE